MKLLDPQGRCFSSVSSNRRALRADEAAGHGVTVFCVSPGLVRTRMVAELLGEAGRRGWEEPFRDVGSSG